MRRHDRKLDLAARAAWLYYVAGNTQDEIAEQLNVSRQAVQRLVSLAVSEKLIKFRLDHPLADVHGPRRGSCAHSFGLAYCSVQPADPGGEKSERRASRIAAAEHLATYLAQNEPARLAFSTGRMLRAMADEMPAMSCPQHKLVSLVGTISRDGQASSYEVVTRFAERTGAQCFPMPDAGGRQQRRGAAPAADPALVTRWSASWRPQAVAAFVGIGKIGWQAPHASRSLRDRPGDHRADRQGCGRRDRRLGVRRRRPGDRQRRSTSAMPALPLHELRQTADDWGQPAARNG